MCGPLPATPAVAWITLGTRRLEDLEASSQCCSDVPGTERHRCWIFECFHVFLFFCFFFNKNFKIVV